MLLASLKVERFWCRYLCPLGALLVPFQRLAWWKVARTPGRCIRCGACDRACPVGLEPLGTERVLSGECLACGRCVCACPAPGALAFTGVQGRTLSPLRLGLAGVGLFLLVWAGARATGIWATFAPPRQESVQTSPGEGIYGWMTLEEVSRSLGIPAERLILLGGLDPGPQGFWIGLICALTTAAGLLGYRVAVMLRRLEQEKGEWVRADRP